MYRGGTGIIQRLRNQDQAVERQVLSAAFQHVGDCGGASGAETFACNEFWRLPAFVFRDPGPDEFGNGSRIFIQSPEIFVFPDADRSAETRSNRVNEHEVGVFDHKMRVVAEFIGRRAVVGAGVAVYLHDFRAKKAEMQPYGSRAGAAVKNKRDRAGGVNRGF